MRAFSRLLLMALLGLALALPAHAADKLKVLIVDGQNNHKWAATTPVIKAMLEQSGRFTVDVATTPPKGSPAEAWAKFRPDFKAYKAIFVNYNDYGHGDQWPAEVQQALVEYMRGEGGLVIYHAANNAFPMWPEWNRMIALNWQGKEFGDGIKLNENGQMLRIPKGQGPGAGHAAQHEYEVKLTPVQHPVTQGFPKKWMHVKDELYHGQRGPALNMVVLAYAFDDPAAANHAGTGQNEPLVYTVSCGKSRVFVDLMGHDVPQTSAPDMVALLTRGTEWAATGQVTLPLPEGFKGE